MFQFGFQKTKTEPHFWVFNTMRQIAFCEVKVVSKFIYHLQYTTSTYVLKCALVNTIVCYYQ